MLPEHTVITAYGPENSSGAQCAVDPLLLALGWGGGGGGCGSRGLAQSHPRC